MKRLPLLFVLLLAAAPAAAAPPLALAMLSEEGVRWQSLTPAAEVPDSWQEGTVPLGSLWKLFAWLYASGNALPDTPYHCTTQREAGDEYCCEAGQEIGRDLALARSCGAYFAPARLGVRASDWQRWWQATAPDSPWLHHLGNLRPDFRVPVAEILRALQAVPPRARGQARAALLQRLMQPAWQAFLAQAGSGYRFKTFTWDDPQHPDRLLGGAAGWTAAGQPFWIGGEGRSRDVMQSAAARLPALLPLPAPLPESGAESCVDVAFFQRYPLLRVQDAQGQALTQAGRLPGSVQVVFRNAHTLPVDSAGRLYLRWQGRTPLLSGRFGLEEYVARVVDREGDARETAAAQALAVAARTWLLQNARFEHGCWQVADDSRMQRVSPNPPTAAAWRVAAFTEGLVLKGQPVFYHRSQDENGRMAWQQAVAQSRAGADYVRILAAAFPRAAFAAPDGGDSCRPLPQAEAWLRQRLPRVREILLREPGYEEADVSVCLLNYGNPYSDQRQQRIWIRRWQTQDDRVALWHEYLHIAFRDYPRGRDEDYLESLARRLTEVL